MTDITITREDGPTGGRYVTVVNGHEAEMTYSRAGTSRIIIDHTGVPKELAGMGVGKALVFRAVEDARTENFKIIPLCPFAKATLDKNPDWQDVVQ
ncbi:MAG: GNAT family N-acetyltransferase [Henriciella sp.]|nr:GNAT family N-acetyltransferase [Henriciella sp.]